MATGIDAWRTKTVDWYGDGYREKVESERQYVVIGDIRGSQNLSGDYGFNSRDENVDLTLYLDPATGLAVWDVEAYEKWLKR